MNPLRTIGAAVLVAGGFYAAWTWQGRTIDAQAAEIASQAHEIAIHERSIVTLQKTAQNLRAANDLAWATADRVAANAAVVQAQYETYLKGIGCEPTDPSCAIDFINRLLQRD